jgi:hypothetical protein
VVITTIPIGVEIVRTRLTDKRAAAALAAAAEPPAE